MDVYLRPESRNYYYRFTLNGKEYRGSTKQRDKQLALRVLDEEVEKVKRRLGYVGSNPMMTLGEACRRYVESKPDGKTRKSLDLSRRKLLGEMRGVWHLDPRMQMDELRTHHIAELKSARSREGLKNNSINLEVRFIQRVWNLCKKEWGVSVDPEVNFSILPAFVRTRYLRKHEQEEVLTLLDKPGRAYEKARDLFLVLLQTGLRISEALSIDKHDVDLHGRTIEVWRSKSSEPAHVPMSKVVAEIMRRRLKDGKPFQNMDRAVRLLRNAISLACNQNSKVVEQRGAATIHSLRDTFVTEMTKKGMSLHKVGKIVGHSSIAMTKKYAHLESRDVVDEARALLD